MFTTVFAVAVLGSSALGFSAAQAGVGTDTVPSLVITRRQAVAEALDRNPQLHASRQQVEEARARVWEASALPDPAGVYTPSTKDAGIEFALPFPDKIRLSGSAAHSDLKAYEFDYQAASQQIASQTAQAYDALLVALRHQEDFGNAVELADDFVTKTQARRAGGRGAGGKRSGRGVSWRGRGGRNK